MVASGQASRINSEAPLQRPQINPLAAGDQWHIGQSCGVFRQKPAQDLHRHRQQDGLCAPSDRQFQPLTADDFRQGHIRQTRRIAPLALHLGGLASVPRPQPTGVPRAPRPRPVPCRMPLHRRCRSCLGPLFARPDHRGPPCRPAASAGGPARSMLVPRAKPKPLDPRPGDHGGIVGAKAQRRGGEPCTISAANSL